LKILEHSAPDDFILASGRTHSPDVAETAFASLGLSWQALRPLDERLCDRDPESSVR
jgi:GDP-D-mannose dehydratase